MMSITFNVLPFEAAVSATPIRPREGSATGFLARLGSLFRIAQPSPGQRELAHLNDHLLADVGFWPDYPASHQDQVPTSAAEVRGSLLSRFYL